MHKIILISVCTFLFSDFIFAGNNSTAVDSAKIKAAICQSAKDSVKNCTARGEINFYNNIKYVKDQYYFITLTKDSYSRTVTTKGKPADAYMSCYNKAIQKILDSIYKGDFFRKADSILAEYDKSGRGYRNADFPGGAPALQKYLEKNVTFPKDASSDDQAKIIRIYYSFIVDEKGAISDINLVKSNCKKAEEIVLAAVKGLPSFIPATEAGSPKKVKYILPFLKKME